MFFYSTSNKFTHPLQRHKLSSAIDEKWLKQAALWAEEQWGYIRNFPGLSYREQVIQQLQDKFYIVTYADQPIGMFALLDKGNAKELMYFYVDNSFRGIGLGSRMMQMAKEVCQEQKAEMIVLDTLNPNLNRFYEKFGAKVVCDGQLLGHPTTIMRI